MKKILAVAAALSLAALFTACDDSSSDTSSNTIYCYQEDDEFYDECDEVVLVDASFADAARKECEGSVGKIVSSCPSGAVKTCSVTDDRRTLTSYYYTGADPNKACEDF